MKYPGLLAVAISRVRTASGLRVVGLTRDHILQPDSKVIAAINELPSGVRQDESSNCCKLQDVTILDNEFDIYFSSDDEDDSFEFAISYKNQQSAETNKATSQQSH
jgi:hypothetical protein